MYYASNTSLLDAYAFSAGLGDGGWELGFVSSAAVGPKPSASTTKPGTQRVPDRLIQATQVAFVM
jgi:hypothetical protein